MYTAIVVLLMIVLPIGSILAEMLLGGGGVPILLLIGKWFVFWAAGWRLMLAGIKQISQPQFTAHEIFKMKTDEALPIVRELGIANFAVGVLGVASIWATSFVLPVAIAGAIFYGAAGIQHVTLKDKSGNESLAMATDLLAFAVLAAYVLYVWFS
ncbi:DUF6790 family protein [Mesorhizobium sp. VNQ89]|uniref:DUF6790 family protein n=1 Tax=Mesorhizobium quangtriensis TaxID=3157709 RepID=UPI0032B80FBF